MNIGKKWAVVIICTLIAIICGLSALLFLKNANPDTASGGQSGKGEQAKPESNAKPSLPIEAKFVSFGGKNYLKITAKPGADLASELEIQISKWRGSDSKHEISVQRLLKKDSMGIYFQTPPNPNVVPDYYAYRIRFPELFYTMSSYTNGGRGYFWREYATYLPGDTVQILNTLCEPIVIQCPLKINEQSDIKPDSEGKIDFIRK